MLISLKRILELAEADNMAIAAFNVTSLEGILAAVSAAEELHTPIILQFANVAHKEYISMETIGPVMVETAERAKVPVCVHLDHGENFLEIKTALDIGFTGIMYDGSALPYEKNVANTRYAVELVREYGVSLEAELGSLGREESESAAGAAPSEASYTDPALAGDFIRQTGADALACSFGTVHGIYLSEPKLDFERIEKIRKETGVPVVMHGGSGISDEDFRRCIDRGVRKINFYTYAAKYAGDAVRKLAEETSGNLYIHDVFLTARHSMKKTYMETLRVFRNDKEK